MRYILGSVTGGRFHLRDIDPESFGMVFNILGICTVLPTGARAAFTSWNDTNRIIGEKANKLAFAINIFIFSYEKERSMQVGRKHVRLVITNGSSDTGAHS